MHAWIYSAEIQFRMHYIRILHQKLFLEVFAANQTKERSIHERFPGAFGNKSSMWIVLVFPRKKRQNSQKWAKFVNFSFWPFLWFGLLGRLLIMAIRPFGGSYNIAEKVGLAMGVLQVVFFGTAFLKWPHITGKDLPLVASSAAVETSALLTFLLVVSEQRAETSVFLPICWFLRCPTMEPFLLNMFPRFLGIFPWNFGVPRDIWLNCFTILTYFDLFCRTDLTYCRDQNYSGSENCFQEFISDKLLN